MNPLLRFEYMLSDYRSLFKYNNFDHFQTSIRGLINTPHRGTMTQVYVSTEKSRTYWPLPKFLSRSKWSVDKLTSFLTPAKCKILSVRVSMSMTKPIRPIMASNNLAHTLQKYSV